MHSYSPSELSSFLKEKSIDYIAHHLQNDFYAFEKKHDAGPYRNEKNADAELMARFDDFLLFGETRQGVSVIDALLKEMPLSLEERKVLEDWRSDAFGSFFDVLAITDEWLRLRDVVSETEYEVHLNTGSSATDIFPKDATGFFLYSNLAPACKIWFFSGIQRLFPPEIEEDLFRKFVQRQSPATWYRHNPKKLEKAFEFQKKHYDVFVRVFGTNEIVVSGREVSASLKRFYGAWFDLVGQKDRPTPEEDLPSDIVEADDVGIIMDAREGLHHILDYRAFLKGFSRDKPTETHRRLVRQYLRDETVPAFLFRRVRDRDPEAFQRVMGGAILPLTRNFDFAADFDLLMDRHKPGWQEVYPSVHPINERFRKYYYRQHDVGRNDPCPCGSGVKYKRCCGV